MSEQIKKPAKEIIERAMDYCESGEDTMGLCIACGLESDCVEPDARNYHCDECGEDQVYGCEEILVQFGWMI